MLTILVIQQQLRVMFECYPEEIDTRWWTVQVQDLSGPITTLFFFCFFLDYCIGQNLETLRDASKECSG